MNTADPFDWLPQSLRWEAVALYAGRTETGSTADLFSAFAEVAERHGVKPPPCERERLLGEIEAAEAGIAKADGDRAGGLLDEDRHARVTRLIEARLARLRAYLVE